MTDDEIQTKNGDKISVFLDDEDENISVMIFPRYENSAVIDLTHEEARTLILQIERELARSRR